MTDPAPDRSRPRPADLAIRAVVGMLLVVALGLAVAGRLPTAPLFLLFTALLLCGLWWFAERGGRLHGRPVAAPLEALALLAAVIAAIGIFWALLGAFT